MIQDTHARMKAARHNCSSLHWLDRIAAEQAAYYGMQPEAHQALMTSCSDFEQTEEFQRLNP